MTTPTTKYTFTKEQLQDILIRAIEEYLMLRNDGVQPVSLAMTQAVDTVVLFTDRHPTEYQS